MLRSRAKVNENSLTRLRPPIASRTGPAGIGGAQLLGENVKEQYPSTVFKKKIQYRLHW